jgi:hypothetical protein
MGKESFSGIRILCNPAQVLRTAKRPAALVFGEAQQDGVLRD